MTGDYAKTKARAMAAAIWDHPKDSRHGTCNGYTNLKCRCARCRAAWAQWFAEARLRRLSRLEPGDKRHGQYTTYFNYSCRCDACKAAKASYERNHRRRQAVS